MDNAARTTNQGQGGSLRSPSSKPDLRPTPDELYLADKLNGDILWAMNGEPPPETKHEITIPALQKWNTQYGIEATTSALRTAWGFPPMEGIENPWAYVDAILRSA